MGFSIDSISNYSFSSSSDWLSLNDAEIGMDPIVNRNPKLHAEKISIYDYPTTGKIISAWASIAREKGQNPLATDSERWQFQSCAWISEIIADSLLSTPDCDESIYVSKDEEGNIQGAMILEVRRSDIYIDFLVTNPVNIRSSVNDHETKKVAGSGTCLLAKAEEVARKWEKETIRLTPLSSAINFYLKNGFSYVNYYMVKTVEKICDAITFPEYKVA